MSNYEQARNVFPYMGMDVAPSWQDPNQAGPGAEASMARVPSTQNNRMLSNGTMAGPITSNTLSTVSSDLSGLPRDHLANQASNSAALGFEPVSDLNRYNHNSVDDTVGDDLHGDDGQDLDAFFDFEQYNRDVEHQLSESWQDQAQSQVPAVPMPLPIPTTQQQGFQGDMHRKSMEPVPPVASTGLGHNDISTLQREQRENSAAQVAISDHDLGFLQRFDLTHITYDGIEMTVAETMTHQCDTEDVLSQVENVVAQWNERCDIRNVATAGNAYFRAAEHSRLLLQADAATVNMLATAKQDLCGNLAIAKLIFFSTAGRTAWRHLDDTLRAAFFKDVEKATAGAAFSMQDRKIVGIEISITQRFHPAEFTAEQLEADEDAGIDDLRSHRKTEESLWSALYNPTACSSQQKRIMLEEVDTILDSEASRNRKIICLALASNLEPGRRFTVGASPIVALFHIEQSRQWVRDMVYGLQPRPTTGLPTVDTSSFPQLGTTASHSKGYVMGLTDVICEVPNFEAARKAFNMKRRKVNPNGGIESLNVYCNNKQFFVWQLKKAMSSRVPGATDESDRNDKFLLDLSKLDDSRTPDETVSILAYMVLESFIDLYEYGDRLYKDNMPRIATFKVTDYDLTPEHRMQLILNYLLRSKLLCSKLLAGPDYITEFVATPYSTFHATVSAKFSNDQKKLRLQRLLQGNAAIGANGSATTHPANPAGDQAVGGLHMGQLQFRVTVPPVAPPLPTNGAKPKSWILQPELRNAVTEKPEKKRKRTPAAHLEDLDPETCTAGMFPPKKSRKTSKPQVGHSTFSVDPDSQGM